MGEVAALVAAYGTQAGAVVAAGAGVASVVQGKKAAKAEEKSQETQQKINDLKTARERRSQVRQARAQRSEIVAGSGAGGTLQSSSSISAAGNVGTQLGSNLSFIDQTQKLSSQASIFNIQAAKASSNATLAKTVAGAGVATFKQAGGVEKLDEFFGR